MSESEYAETVACPHCDAPNGIDPIHDGEIRRGTTCTECREWFPVFSSGDS
ncbi:hypothetical protein HISP_18145 (plasmid) [Haloarcula hispanica N601]|uniref:Small CPxCG-related zinc finger protein n=2 Tax=Haloarcula hispanica TaxID=51589 RepID=V5TTE2_HALHI|nr:conserved hypothetical protein [Haloarcula hispanica ATCC 33960]AHB67975.1 hypothetical protein HISP_18145 [Haloarcula hispanica N601]